MSKRMRRALKRLRSAFREPITRVERGSWREQAQEGELAYHVGDAWRQTDAFQLQTERLMEHFGLGLDSYAGKVVIDLGAGSRLRTRCFRGAEIVAIEPLADRFRSDIGWCDLDEASAVYSTPAEDRVDDYVGRADLVFSMNVLDHCFDFGQCIENVRDYLKADGLAFLSFDKHQQADEMHPLELDEGICERVFEEKGLSIERASTGFGGVLEGHQTYGHGPYCLNYWLRRALP